MKIFILKYQRKDFKEQHMIAAMIRYITDGIAKCLAIVTGNMLLIQNVTKSRLRELSRRYCI